MNKKCLLLFILSALCLMTAGCQKDSPIPPSASSTTAFPEKESAENTLQDDAEKSSGNAGGARDTESLDSASEPHTGRQSGPQTGPQTEPQSGPQDGPLSSAHQGEAAGGNTQPASDEGIPPAENPEYTEEEPELQCTMTIDCSAVFDHLDKFDPDKLDLLPADGILYQAENLPFSEGETVFDLLKRVTAANKIHMEFSSSPVYHTAYVEGINNIYEFDCGELSGWEYRVNGSNPGYGCSQYTLKNGDAVEWVYTCDLGRGR